MKTDVLNKNSNAFAQEVSVKPNAVEYHGASFTLTNPEDVGTTHIITADATVTLPATSAGLSYVLVASEDDVEITVSPNASDKFLGGCGKAAAGADNKDLIFSNGKAGDCVQLLADGTNGWFITHLSDASKVSYES